MRYWDLLGEAPVPGDKRRIRLYRGKDDFFIKLSGGDELMNSRSHQSEDALGTIPCQRLAHRPNLKVLVGGMGMGFTLAAALKAVAADAEVTVAELIPEVVDWNRGPLGERAGKPLTDPRVRVEITDVAQVLRANPGYFDVIALDVDNGPEGLTSRRNDRLYTDQGIAAAQAALRDGGILAYWSASPDPAFAESLRHSGLLVEEVMVHAHGKKGPKHTIWLAS